MSGQPSLAVRWLARLVRPVVEAAIPFPPPPPPPPTLVSAGFLAKLQTGLPGSLSGWGGSPKVASSDGLVEDLIRTALADGRLPDWKSELLRFAESNRITDGEWMALFQSAVRFVSHRQEPIEGV